MPLFVHEGPLTCTGPERGTLPGPSECAGAGNPRATGSLQGCAVFHPGALVAGSWSLGVVVGLALHVRRGWPYCPGPGAQGQERPLHTWVSMAPRGDAPPPLRLDLERVESGWGDGDPVRSRNRSM